MHQPFLVRRDPFKRASALGRYLNCPRTGLLTRRGATKKKAIWSKHQPTCAIDHFLSRFRSFHCPVASTSKLGWSETLAHSCLSGWQISLGHSFQKSLHKNNILLLSITRRQTPAQIRFQLPQSSFHPFEAPSLPQGHQNTSPSSSEARAFLGTPVRHHLARLRRVLARKPLRIERHWMAQSCSSITVYIYIYSFCFSEVTGFPL